MHYGIGDLFRKMLKEKALKGLYLAAMFAVIIAIAMTITGCGQAAEENGEEGTLSPVELQIWDDIIGEYVFEEEVELDKDGNPVNQDYYDFLFQDAAYGWSDD